MSTKRIMTLLEELCGLYGISGDEGDIRSYILSHLDASCSAHTDNLGNIIVEKKGKKSSERKLMLAAHMDEVGMIVTSVRSDGTLSFATVGGVDTSVIAGRNVKVGKNRLNGVVGSTAVHNLSSSERKKMPEVSSLYIDIGALDKKDALQYVAPGDSVMFDSDFHLLGDGFCASRAIDDRAGCAILLDIAMSPQEYDMTLAFTVQEEVGLRGARTAAYGINPDCAIVFETTTAADIPGVEGGNRVCILGNGPAVVFMDRSTIYDKELYAMAHDIANKQNIAVQTKTMIAGGNDSGAIHITRGGVKTLAISAPCRYLHSGSVVMKYKDLELCADLGIRLAERVCGNA